MSLEDAQTLAVWLFDEGWPCSRIDAYFRAHEGFARDAIIEWWIRMGERDDEYRAV